MGDHHACDLQGPFSPAMITENLYKCGIIEYKSKKSDVNQCVDDYCRHELAILRARNPKLAKRTILFTIDSGEAAFKVNKVSNQELCAPDFENFQNMYFTLTCA